MIARTLFILLTGLLLCAGYRAVVASAQTVPLIHVSANAHLSDSAARRLDLPRRAPLVGASDDHGEHRTSRIDTGAALSPIADTTTAQVE